MALSVDIQRGSLGPMNRTRGIISAEASMAVVFSCCTKARRGSFQNLLKISL